MATIRGDGGQSAYTGTIGATVVPATHGATSLAFTNPVYAASWNGTGIQYSARGVMRTSLTLPDGIGVHSFTWRAPSGAPSADCRMATWASSGVVAEGAMWQLTNGKVQLRAPGAANVSSVADDFLDGGQWSAIHIANSVAGKQELHLFDGAGVYLETIRADMGTATIVVHEEGLDTTVTWSIIVDGSRIDTEPTPQLLWSWVSGLTSSGAQIYGQVIGADAVRVSLAGVSTTEYTPTVDAEGVFRLTLTGLPASRVRVPHQYQVFGRYATGTTWKVASETLRFQTLTPVGEIGTQKWMFYGCQQNRGVNPSPAHVYDDPQVWGPNGRIMLGDDNYSDETSTDPNAHKHWWVSKYRNPGQRRLVGTVGGEDVWSDHDGGGPGNGIDSAAILANYSKWTTDIPHVPLPAGAPTGARYRAFTSGRWRFILLDTRSAQRVSSSGGVGASNANAALGSAQMAWVEAELKNPDYGTKFQSFLFIHDFVTQTDNGGQLPGKPDSFSAYPASVTELRAIKGRAEVFHGTGPLRMFQFQGDWHVGVGDNGTNNEVFPGVPLFGMCGIDRGSGNADGAWTSDELWPGRIGGIPITGELFIYGRVSLIDSGSSMTVKAVLRDTLAGVDRFTIKKTWTGLPNPTAARGGFTYDVGGLYWDDPRWPVQADSLQRGGGGKRAGITERPMRTGVTITGVTGEPSVMSWRHLIRDVDVENNSGGFEQVQSNRDDLLGIYEYAQAIKYRPYLGALATREARALFLTGTPTTPVSGAVSEEELPVQAMIPERYFRDLQFSTWLQATPTNVLDARVENLDGTTAPVEDTKFLIAAPATSVKIVDLATGFFVKWDPIGAGTAVGDAKPWILIDTGAWKVYRRATAGWTDAGGDIETDPLLFGNDDDPNLIRPHYFPLTPVAEGDPSDRAVRVAIYVTGASSSTYVQARMRGAYVP